MALPGVISYCKITGLFLEATADTSGDPDDLPQGNPLVGATITFRAAPSAIRTSSPAATTIPREFVCSTDASGYLYSPGVTLGEDGNAPTGKRFLYIMASDDPDIEPHNWSWYFKVYRDDLPSISGSFIATADGEIDLATVVQVPASPGAETAAWIQAVSAATDARDAAEAARDLAVEAAAHPSDPAVAALIDDPGSQVRASLSSTYASKGIPAAVAPAINVLTEYGSVTNATIQQALDDAATDSNGRRAVYVPAGEYTITDSLVPRNNVWLFGAGIDQTILKPVGDEGAIRYNVDTEGASAANTIVGFRVSDLTVDGIGQFVDVQASDYPRRGIAFQFAQRCVVERVKVVNTWRTGIAYDHPRGGCRVEGCVVDGAGRGVTDPLTQTGGNGIGCTVSADVEEVDNAITISRNLVLNTKGRGGILMVGSVPFGHPNPGVLVDGNTVLYSAFAAFFDSATYGVRWRNNIARGGQYGFYLGRGEIDGRTPCVSSVIGNTVISPTIDGIYLTTTYDTAEVTSANQQCVIADNVIRSCGKNGIWIDAGLYSIYNVVLSDNQINVANTSLSAGTAGIKVSAVSGKAVRGLTMVGNQVLNAVQKGILLSGDITDLVYLNHIAATSTPGALDIGLRIQSGTITRGSFAGTITGYTTPLDLTTAPTFVDVSVATPMPGWTQNNGAPTTKAPKGTIYERKDGSAGSLLYVNTDGGTTWSAFA